MGSMGSSVGTAPDMCYRGLRTESCLRQTFFLTFTLLLSEGNWRVLNEASLGL